MNAIYLAGALAITVLPVSISAAELPDTIAAPGETLIATIQAQGAQIYECKADAVGELAFQFREPIATLFENSRPAPCRSHWELIDGSVVSGKVAGRAPGLTANDIPLLKLEVTSRRGTGRLSAVTTIQRLNTKGGATDGTCETLGAFLSVP
jgi:hypothetical protein